jgi:hypothetical protein
MAARIEFPPQFDRIVQEASEAGLVEVARSIADEVVRTAPVDSGDYRASIEVFSYRWGVGVQTTDPAGHIIEWGSDDTDPLAPIRSVAAEYEGYRPA